MSVVARQSVKVTLETQNGYQASERRPCLHLPHLASSTRVLGYRGATNLTTQYTISGLGAMYRETTTFRSAALGMEGADMLEEGRRIENDWEEFLFSKKEGIQSTERFQGESFGSLLNNTENKGVKGFRGMRQKRRRIVKKLSSQF